VEQHLIQENPAIATKILRRKQAMRMLLKKIHIQNFKGCKDRAIDFGIKTAIKGINGSGKTTIADAVMWVLFGKDSSGASSFDIRPKDALGTDIDFVEIQVETVWDIDGKEVTIVKTQKQDWVKKRGSEEQTFQGNTNSYEVNTIPKAEKEFKAYIEQLVPEEVFKFVSNTNAFMAQKSADRRKALFKLVSDITDADVLATDPKLNTGLSEELSKFTAEEIMSRDKKALLENKKKLEEIPARIDEVSKTIVEVDYSDSEKKLQDLREQIASVENGSPDVSVYDQVNQLKAEISRYKGELQEIERDANTKVAGDRRAVQCKIIDTDQSLTIHANRIPTYERQVESLKRNIANSDDSLEKLGNDYKTEKAREMAEGSNLCPVCHQEYPADMHENMEAAFASEKEKKLLEINMAGKSISNAVKSFKAELADYDKKLEDEKTEIERLKTEKDKLQKVLEVLPSSVDLSSNANYQAAQNSLINAEMNLQIALDLTKDADARKQALADQKRAIQTEIDAVNRILSGKQTIANAKLRVEELKEEQRRLSQDIASTEREIYLLEEFNKAKVNLLSDKINAHFRIVRWKLFERQINGGYNPICEPLVNGQSYSSALNSGHKILAELDIIQALQKIYKVSAPVFLDNAERINDFNVPHMDCQLITLSVTEDSELRVVNN
jgi:DNA repair exonuclease SbcCD ATPase subunit